jgi:hypothetical protein
MPQTIKIFFRRKDAETFPMLDWEVHTYGFLEVKQLDGKSTFHNTGDICSFEPSAPSGATPLPRA